MTVPKIPRTHNLTNERTNIQGPTLDEVIDFFPKPTKSYKTKRLPLTSTLPRKVGWQSPLKIFWTRKPKYHIWSSLTLKFLRNQKTSKPLTAQFSSSITSQHIPNCKVPKNQMFRASCYSPIEQKRDPTALNLKVMNVPKIPTTHKTTNERTNKQTYIQGSTLNVMINFPKTHKKLQD